MKTKLTFLLGLLATALSLPAFAQVTAITYQGVLSGASSTANGSYDFSFQLFDAATGGASQGGPLTTNGVSVVNGLFTVNMDFGAGPFSSGAPRWLQIAVRTNGGGGFDPVTTRQALTATPYAIAAGKIIGPVDSASVSGNYSNAVNFGNAANTFAGAFGGNGNGLSNVNATALGGVAVSNLWQTGGNANPSQVNPPLGAQLDFLGTTDNRPLLFKVRNMGALTLAPSPSDVTHSAIVNVIGGSQANLIFESVYGGTIAGGGADTYDTFFGPRNVVTADFGTVGGGLGNSSGSRFATVSGGAKNSVDPASDASTIGGGQNNLIRASGAFVGLPPASTIGGGYNNIIGAPLDPTFIFPNAGIGNTIGGGIVNQILGNSGNGVIAGGVMNKVDTNSIGATIGGGFQNWIRSDGNFSTIGGGSGNVVAPGSFYSTIAGGVANVAGGNYATVPGGWQNVATNFAFAAGYSAKALHDGSFVWADFSGGDFASTAANQFLIRASGGVGIGTASPTLRLTIGGAGNYTNLAAAAIMLDNTTTAGRRWEWHSLDDGRMQFVDFGAAASRLLIDTNGNVGIGVTVPTNKLHVAGGVSATAFVTTSDRNAKENFTDISPTEVLAKVSSLPITKWNFKEMKDGPHLGPMAQDFYAAFGLGGGETTITTVDADGVALAAIQGLNQKLVDELKRRDVENAELRCRLEKIERLLLSQNAKAN